VQALKGKLLGEGAERPIPGGTDNAKAYQAYLLGVHYRNRGALKETVQHASNAFQRAIELDPQYAKAYAALANNWIDKVWNGYVSQEEGVLKINAAATRAIELAPELADGYLALSLLKQIDYKDPRGALEAISTAITLNPGNARMQIEFARMNSHLGHREISTKAARRAVELDPVSVFANHILGHVLYFNRQYEDAIAAFRHTLQLDPHYPKPHYFISMSYYWLGDTESALQEIQQEPLRWMKLTASAVILHRLGRTAEAEENFAALVELGNDENNYNQQAAVHAQWGDKEKAIGCLDLAFSQGDPGLTQLLVDPFLDPIRNDPRFIEIVRKVGLPDS
jgi:tetratricopeptide (TPR) repeat protein